MQDAAYWISVAHLNKWTNRQINELITQIYHENKSDLKEFFALNESDWENLYKVETKRIPALSEAKEQLANNAFLAESLLNQGYELIALNSPEYSPVLKENLKMTYSPPLLYIKGNKQILHENSIAIVGSRNASTKGIEFTKNVAKKASAEYRVVVSGFAKGIDKAALDFALEYRGHSIIVLPQGIMTFGSGFKKYYRQIVDGDLLVLSTFHPKSPWHVRLAMARNPIIYGLAKDIYVADSSNTGGTWAGVKDGLRKGRTIYIRQADAGQTSANNLLIEMGGRAVDIKGDLIKEDLIQKPESPKALSQENLNQKIIDLLSENSLSAREICLELDLDTSAQKMVAKLGKMKELEKIKVGRSVKYTLRQQEIFDLNL